MKTEAADGDKPEPREAPAADPQLQEPTEEEREQREAEFEEQLRARVVRSDLIGRDRHFRRYWWLQGRALTISRPSCSQLRPFIRLATFCVAQPTLVVHCFLKL